MPRKFHCPICGSFVVTFIRAGETARCFNCREQVVVPKTAWATTEFPSWYGRRKWPPGVESERSEFEEAPGFPDAPGITPGWMRSLTHRRRLVCGWKTRRSALEREVEADPTESCFSEIRLKILEFLISRYEHSPYLLSASLRGETYPETFGPPESRRVSLDTLYPPREPRTIRWVLHDIRRQNDPRRRR